MFAGNGRYGAPSGEVTTIGFVPPTLTSNVRRGCEAKTLPGVHARPRPRLLIAALSFAAILITAQPASAEVVWWNEPPLPYGSPVTFVDSVIGTVRSDLRDEWRAKRNRALDMWGVPYTIVRNDNLAPFDAAVSEERNGFPGVIRLGRDVSGACQSYGGWYGTVGGGVAVICLPPRWWAIWDVGGSLAHEVGHAFGLGHSTTGIMSGGVRVSDEERLAVQGYYA